MQKVLASPKGKSFGRYRAARARTMDLAAGVTL
jgi:hypothetical protein